ncbi:MAG: hypothetical protein JNJ77_01330 [Planctomycetia bacterium]|nr:hypothetical protein [Planctomycetia bacterium]
MLRRWFLLSLTTGLAWLLCFSPLIADERVFIGLFQVKAEQRDALMAKLKEHGFHGVYVPENGSPDTLLYRGTKTEYEKAYETTWKWMDEKGHLKLTSTQTTPKPSMQVKKATVLSRDDQITDEEAFDKLLLSPLQKELAQAVMKEMKEKSKEFQDTPPTPELIKKGTELNQWMRKSLRAIFTRDQYTQYFKLYGATPTEEELGPAPKVTKPNPKAKKTDEAIFSQLGMSDKQKEHLDKLQKWMKDATAKMKAKTEGHIEEGASLNDKWRAGLDRILTKSQRKQYMDYWGPPPALIR